MMKKGILSLARIILLLCCLQSVYACDDGDFVNHSVLFVGISKDVVYINWGYVCSE